MRELNSVEEKILDRALFLIGKNRTMNISIRAIAKEADVNVGAINYYFRTKKEMLKQVRSFYINNTLSISSILDNKKYDKEEKLFLAANEIMEYIIRLPGVTVILSDALNSEEVDDISREILNVTREMHEKIEKVLYNVTNANDQNIRYKYLVFMSSVIYPVDQGKILNFNKTIAISKETRIEYIKHLIRILKTE